MGKAIGVLLAVVLSLSSMVRAQVWCPPGAEWISKPPPFWPVLGYDRVFYAGDTIVGGISGQRLSRQHAERSWSDPTIYYYMIPTAMITALENGVVLLWSDQLAEWDTLFWFSAQPGDRWHRAHDIPIPGNPGDRIEVVDTSTMIVDGVALRQLHVEQVCNDQWVNWAGTITERLGYWTPFYFPGACSTESGIWGLTCYNDVELHFQPGEACDVFLSQSERSELRIAPFPNPGTDHFALQLPSGMHTITVLDTQGRSVLNSRSTDGSANVDTRSLHAGIYLVQIIDPNGSMGVHRWVKE